MSADSSRATASALSAQSLRLQYGDLAAVWEASFEIGGGVATAVVGRNGAGKSTLMSGLAGLLQPAAGRLLLHGQDITHARAWRRVEGGLALVPEGKRIFRDLSVEENIMLGAAKEHTRSGRKRVVAGLFERFPILAAKRDAAGGALSGGQQQLLAIASALASSPSVLLLDEPSSGLSPVALDSVLELLVGLKQDGLTIVVVEQQVEDVVSVLADKVIVLDRGRITLDEDARTVSAKDLEDRLYVDDGVDAVFRHRQS